MYSRKTFIRISIFLLTALVITSCGESDLVDLHERELSDARTAYENAIGGATPDTGGGSTGGDTGGGDTGGSTDGGGDTSGNTDGGNTGGGFEDVYVESTPNGIDLNQYSLVFNDEFSAPNLDTSKWNTALTWGPDLVIYNQLQYYVDMLSAPDFGYNPFSIGNGALTITASQTPDNLRSAANEQAWLSGVITSASKFDFTYGYIESRVLLQAGQGVWPSFWMLSSAFEGLKPELFIMEYDGAKPDSLFHNYNYQDAEGNLRSPGQWEVSSPDFSEGFRKVGVLWSPGELLYYIDDEPRYRIVGDNVATQNMYLILNLAMGGIWPGTPDATTPNPVSMSIDYVRVFQLNQ